MILFPKQQYIVKSNKMKHLCVFLCLVLPILANELPEEERVFLKNVHDTCQSNKRTYADEDLLRKLSENVDNHQVQVHMMCMSIEAGLQKETGELNVDVIRSKVASTTQQRSLVEDVVDKCAVEKNTPELTGTLIWLCFYENNIPYLHKL